MWEALKNAFKLPDLRKKLLWTLFLLAIFRLGSHIVVPGMRPHDFGENNIFSLLDIFSGGALSNMSLFALGVNPYITASIIMTLLTMVIPRLEELSKEGTEGRKVISKYTRYGTVVLGLIQASALTAAFREAMVDPTNTWSYISIIVTMTAGTVFLMWLGEVLSERGIGNGISMIIFGGIIARLVTDAVSALSNIGTGGVTIPGIFGSVALTVVVIAFVVVVTQGQRKIPVQYAKRVVGRKMYGGQATHLPLRVNQAGVIPIIFASSVLAFPLTIKGFVTPTSGFARFLDLFTPGNWLYLILYALFIFVFTYFYTAISFNPVEVSNNMKKYGGFIPGIRPGKPTAEYLDRVLTRITLAGALFLMVISLLPYLISPFTGINMGLTGTSLLIAVGVAIDTMKQIEAHLLMRQYEGFLK